MKPSVDFLQSVVRYLSKGKLYEEGHPTLESALDDVTKALRHAQVQNPTATFSFLGGEVLFNEVPVAELNGWGWAYRFAERGIERIEIAPDVEREEVSRFLQFLAERMEREPEELEELAVVVEEDGEEGDGDAAEETAGGEAVATGEVAAEGEEEPEEEEGEGAREDEPFPHIRFGRLKLRGERGGAGGDHTGRGGRLDLGAEGSTVGSLHEGAADEGRVRLSDALAVVESLAVAMRSAESIVAPFLELQDSRRYTAAHCMNVSILAMSLAEELGWMSPRVRAVGTAGLLHDVGKVRVPTEILDKPGELTEEEWAEIRRHPVEGCKILLESDARLEVAAVVAYEHHMNFDGSGYPERPGGREPTEESRLVQVCDLYDAVRARRGYKSPYPAEQAASILEDAIGEELDPDFARPFLEMIQRWDPSEFLEEEGAPEGAAAAAGIAPGEPAIPDRLE